MFISQTSCTHTVMCLRVFRIRSLVRTFVGLLVGITGLYLVVVLIWTPMFEQPRGERNNGDQVDRQGQWCLSNCRTNSLINKV